MNPWRSGEIWPIPAVSGATADADRWEKTSNGAVQNLIKGARLTDPLSLKPGKTPGLRRA
jgi:hypothetical protein